MSAINIQHFRSDGTWRKPKYAQTVDVILIAGGGGGSITITENGADGTDGDVKVWSGPAVKLPSSVAVRIGKGGRGVEFGDTAGGDGADGMIIVITHLDEEASEGEEWAEVAAPAQS